MSDKPVIRATADLHGNLPQIEPCDLLLIAGDVCPDFFSFRRSTGREDRGQQRQAHWLDTVFRDWLEEIPAERVVGIAGNHDYVFEQPFLLPENLRWSYLRDETLDVLMVEYGANCVARVHGTPWCPNLPRWAFYASDAALQARAESIPAGIDILMSHSPPFSFCDTVDPRFGGPMPVGDTALAAELDRIDAQVLVCGHIHEGFGVDYLKTNCMPIYNVSHVNIDYEPVNPVITLPELDYERIA